MMEERSLRIQELQKEELEVRCLETNNTLQQYLEAPVLLLLYEGLLVYKSETYY